jgi:hypothetical protein
MKNMDKKWLKLNSHGKRCLRAYLFAISATDLITTQLDYLNKKGLTDYVSKFKDREKRHPLAGECLTDLGIETAYHYFKKL